MSLEVIFEAIASLGIPGVLLAIGLYVLLRGELIFRYPARGTNRSQETRR